MANILIFYLIFLTLNTSKERNFLFYPRNSNGNERRNGKEIQTDQSLEKLNNADKVEETNNLKSTKIFERRQQTPKELTSTISKHQQQSTEYISSLSSTHPRKLPPITPVSNESAASTRLPSLPPLSNPSNRPETETVSFSRMLDTILNSPSPRKSEMGQLFFIQIHSRISQ